MSLEDAIKENTAAVRELIQVLHAQGGSRAQLNTPVNSAPLVGAELSAVVDNAVKKLEPGASQSTGSTKESAGSSAPSGSGESATLEYKSDIREPFLALLNTHRDKATKLLADLGVTSLKVYENKPEEWAGLSKKIKEAANG